MYSNRFFVTGSIILISLCSFFPAAAQLGFELDIKKPEPYENRELKAERSGQKKFTLPKRVFQNTYTHYNYFFNASTKLNEVIARAKEAHREDFSTLLPFYNYSLETTTAEKAQLDSVIYKSKTGIVMHDLRNDWVDDLYLLWGAAYFLQKQFDSAQQMFQFINYSFADKEKDGYYRYIGSKMDGGNAGQIASRENNKFPKSLIADPPSRNDAFIWQVRTLTEANAFAEAASLISTLRHDPLFPSRLRASLEEVQAYWFYRQGQWDSAAAHLTEALDVAQNREEKARWEFLAGQLYDRSGHQEAAQTWFTKSLDHTADPVMDIYARLNMIRLSQTGNEDLIGQNLEALGKMARRERYADYRDIIYFTMAQMELERRQPEAAQAYLLQGAKYHNNVPASRNRTYQQLADLAFAGGQYEKASAYYDSLQLTDRQPSMDDQTAKRKLFLGRLVANIRTVQRQDSLQRIANLPEDERTEFLKKLARQLRRHYGLKEAETAVGGAQATSTSDDPFRSAGGKGEWYFYNASSKSGGAASFKQVWGNRPNSDNWRRASDATADLRATVPGNTRGNPIQTIDPTSGYISHEMLLETLPTTPAAIQFSNDSISAALLGAGSIYMNEVEDFGAAIRTYEEFRKRFGNYPAMSEVLFQLYYAYNKAGEAAKAAAIKKELNEAFPTSRETSIIVKGTDPTSKNPTAAITKTYEKVYDLFVEGNFVAAKAAKQAADSLYGTHYWSPQLLYIEAVYYIRERADSTAIAILNTLVQRNPQSPVTAKATNLLNVLGRRAQIEEELRNLQIQRPAEDSPVVRTVVPVPPPRQEPKDTAVQKVTPPVAATPQPEPEAPKITAPRMQTGITRDTAAIAKKDVLLRQPATTIRTDSLSKAPPPVPKATAAGFVHNPDAPTFAVVVLNKVDNIFGNEARNAFTRYNREKFSATPPGIQLLNLDGENKLLLIGSFENLMAAVNYVQSAKALAATQIVPWLKAEKYSFTILSEANFEVLKTKPDLAAYRKFVEAHLKGAW